MTDTLPYACGTRSRSRTRTRTAGLSPIKTRWAFAPPERKAHALAFGDRIVSPLVFSRYLAFIRMFFEKLFFLNYVLGKNPLR
ncbi:hypothetical protein SD81_029415 [Tolypothrix campylonemoides VB511288]|nr:hypothetical protein SD81_029415 [Tolypothrix campylonemoides VB511288]